MTTNKYSCGVAVGVTVDSLRVCRGQQECVEISKTENIDRIDRTQAHSIYIEDGQFTTRGYFVDL
jgi:hypothetical protein